jgi:hypothetical protein
LQYEIFEQAANVVVCEGCGDGGFQAKATPQASGHVIFSATFPYFKGASGADSTFSGIEAKHDFSQGNKIPAAFFGRTYI